MPTWFKTQQEAQKQLQEWTARQVGARSQLDALGKELRESFTPEGSFTKRGLEIELHRLDQARRAENVDPADSKAQLLIQGQQNEVVKLLRLHEQMMNAQANLQAILVEAETKTGELQRALASKRGN